MSRHHMLLVLASACSGGGGIDPAGPDAAPQPGPDAPMGMPSIEGTPVSSFETSSCMTSVVLELSRQIADEVNCLMPGQLVTFDETTEIRFAGSAVLPYVSTVARDDLYAATAGSGM